MPGAKSINYIPAILCQTEARNQQAIEAVYVDRDGYMLEGTTSNLFAFIGDTLITPPCNRVLPGITRQVTLTLPKKSFPSSNDICIKMKSACSMKRLFPRRSGKLCPLWLLTLLDRQR